MQKTRKKFDIICDFPRLLILTLLYEKPLSIWGIKTNFERKFRKNVSATLIYSFLAWLKHKEFVTQITLLTPMYNKKIRCFTLTPQGREYYRDVFQRFLDVSRTATQKILIDCVQCNATIFRETSKKYISRDMTKNTLYFCCSACKEAYFVYVPS